MHILCIGDDPLDFNVEKFLGASYKNAIAHFKVVAPLSPPLLRHHTAKLPPHARLLFLPSSHCTSARRSPCRSCRVHHACPHACPPSYLPSLSPRHHAIKDDYAHAGGHKERNQGGSRLLTNPLKAVRLHHTTAAAADTASCRSCATPAPHRPCRCCHTHSRLLPPHTPRPAESC